MKKLLLSLMLSASVSMAAQAQATSCAIAGGAPEPVAPTTEACLTGFNASQLAIQSYATTGTLDTRQVVISRMVNDSSLIVGLSDDGSFNFATGNNGGAYEYGTYDFRVFTFNQGELNALAANLNPLLPLLGYPTIPVGADGNVSLSNVFSTLNLVFPGLTVEDVEYAICDFLPGLGFSLGYGLSSSYSVEWKASGCSSGVADLNAAKFTVSVSNQTANIQLANNTPSLVSIYDLNGKLMAQQAIAANNANFDIASYPAGLYIVQANNGTQTFSTKFVK